MIIYFADRKMHILGKASTNLPKGARITDDLKTEEVEVGVKVFECDLSYTSGNQKKIKEWAKAGNYILRKNGEETEFYTIIDSENDTKSRTISIYAEDAGLDLLNEVVEAYEADQAYPITHYIERFSYDSGFEVGINEVSNLSRKLKWEGEETATARILSVATQFDAEVKYRFEVKGLTITHKYIDIYKKIGMDTGIKLRLNRDIDRIVTKESVANLATALNVKGGTPEGQENPITLNGYQYDDGDFYVDGTMLKSRKALEKWSRYLWETGPDVGHIVQQYSYDTTSQSELCNRAVSQLKKICDMEVNYEVDISVLPQNAKIGDTVYIVDGKDQTYLSARILKLETSASQRTNKATLGEYLIQSRGISQKLEELAQQFQNIAANRIMYTWIVYADDKLGTGISLYPEGKIYMGIAANQLTNIVDLSDPSIFEWSLIKGDKGETGEQGPQGEQGPKGEKGDKGDQGERGLQGLQGEKGDQGIPGPAGKDGEDGTDGKTSYTHIAYANSADGQTDFSVSDSNRDYIGMYVDFTATDSNDPADYAWSKIKGADGAQGTPGKAGEDGKTPYLHIAYANSADGTSGFSVTDSENKLYIGQYTDYTAADSTDPVKYSWTRIKGETGATGPKGDKGDTGAQGEQGPKGEKGDKGDQGERGLQGLQGEKGDQGIPGPAGKDGEDGTDGKTSYTHIAYANSADGQTDFSVSDSNRDYIGMYVDFTATDSNDPADYAWSKIKGADGAQGTPGKAGEDGKTPYLHIAYANSADGTSGFSVTDSENKLYIGQYTDYTAADSTDPVKYSWTRIKGETGATGPKGDKGDTGAQGEQGEKGDKGDTGATGPKGDTGIIVSATAPASPVVGQLWQSAAGQPIKRWDGSKWVIHYLSVENLDVDVLSALSANLGTVTAGKIQNNNSAGYVVIDLATGEIKSYNDTDLATLLINAGKFTMTGKDPNTNLVELGISPEDGFSGVVSNKRISIQPSPASIDGTSTADFALTPEGKTGILMYQRLSNVPEKVYRASLVVNPGGNNYVRLFTNTQLKEMFGNDFVSNRLTGMVINGDANANSNRLAELRYYSTSGLWLYFWSSFSGSFRVNIKLEYG